MQVLHAEHACAQAVNLLIGYLARMGKPTPSPATSTYCEARQKYPETFYRQLVTDSGQRTQQECPELWTFHGRTVNVVDGTHVSAPDTPAIRSKYPLENPEREGLSFPLLRLLVVFSLATGVVLEYGLRAYHGKATGELAMLRELWNQLRGGILLADRGFCSYADVAQLLALDGDVVLRPNQSRIEGLEQLERFGKRDGLYRWKKPRHKPDSLSAEQFARLPAELQVRLVTVLVEIAGFRTQKLEVLTTLTDAVEYPAEELALLYRRRWQCELFLRDIKATLHMDALRCQSPEMVRNEIAMHLWAYNLIRGQMVQAAALGGARPETLSFQSTVYALQGVDWLGKLSESQQATLLATILYHRVGRQPDRVEPRKVRRRKKSYDYLMQPRKAEKEALLKAG